MPAFDFVLGGRYRLTGPLGEGGMAAVYRGRDLRLNREVAIKVLRDDLTRDPSFLSRFQREAEFLAALSHPSIVPVYDVGEEGGTPFIVMEYVRGRTLREVIESEGHLEPGRAVQIMLPVLDALEYAHQKGVIHRDVKPHNILLTVDGKAKLSDFGIAYLADGSTTRTAAILGSAQYLSPEQSRGEEASERSDLYACGIVLWEMLSGHPPFDGPNALAIAHQHLHEPPPPAPGSEAGLDPILRRALAKDPAQRFGSGREFRDALTVLEAAEGETSRQPLAQLAAGTGAQPLALPGAKNRKVATPPRERLSVRRSARKTFLTGLGLALLLFAAAYAASLPVWPRPLPDYPSAPYLAIPAALACVVVLSWLSTRSWSYTMDGTAAIAQWGLLSHHRIGLPLHQIATLQLKQSPIDRLLGVGTIELQARDQEGEARCLVMEDVPRPRAAYDELMHLLARSSRPDNRASDSAGR